MRSIISSIVGILLLATAFAPPSDARSIKEIALERAPVMTGIEPALSKWSLDHMQSKNASTVAPAQRLVDVTRAVVDGVVPLVRPSGHAISSAWHEVLSQATTPALRGVLQAIDVARVSEDPALCAGIDHVLGDRVPPGYTRRSLLALCVALSTRDPARCAQIDPEESPTALDTCRRELEKSPVHAPATALIPYTVHT